MLNKSDNLGHNATDWLFGVTDAQIRHRRADDFFDDVIAHVYDWDLSVGQVISIYGAGGEGKSIFLNNLRDVCLKRMPADVWRVVYLDFFSEENSTLLALRSIFEAFLAAGLFCPRFAVAYVSYQHPGNLELATKEYLREYESCIAGYASTSKTLTKYVRNVLEITSIATDFAGTEWQISPLRDTIDYIKRLWDKQREEQIENEAITIWQDFAAHDKNSLLDRMPPHFRS